MSGFTITITDAGRAALINAQNTGTNAFVLSEVGVSTLAVPGPLKSLTVLPNETKRLATMAGDVVANDTLHVTIRDESASAYALRAFGLYTNTGVLFAVYSQADPIIEKSSAAMLLLAVDARLLTLDTGQVEFGPVGFTLPPATETIPGVTEVATDAEADAGTDNWRYITPRLLKRALGALSGFAVIGHKHSADDINSGTLNAARIPSLAMDKITGLVEAIASKAAAVHTHTIAQIEGLTVALAAKAAASHAHDASDVASGTLNAARIPSLAMEKITGLVAGLAGKAEASHKHSADDINSGTLNAARIPSLAMEKITGLVAGLGSKADDATSLVMRGNLGAANTPNSTLAPGAYRQGTNANAVIANGYPIANDGGTLVVMNPASDTGAQTYFGRSSGRVWSRPFLAGVFSPWVEYWTTGNFDPRNFTAETINGGSTGVDITGSGGLRVSKIQTTAESTISSNNNTDVLKLIRPTSGERENFLVFENAVGVNKIGISGGNLVYIDRSNNAFTVYHSGNLGNASTTARGTVIMANNAQTLAGTDLTRAISPATLWSFAKSIGVSGYQQIPGTDLVIQWGSTNTAFNEGPVHTTLPIAFGGGCLVAMAIPRNAAQSIPRDYYMQVVARYQDRIVFYANHANAQSGIMIGYEWLAIGRARGTPDPVYSPPSSGGDDGGGGEWPPGGGTPIIP